MQIKFITARSVAWKGLLIAGVAAVTGSPVAAAGIIPSSVQPTFVGQSFSDTDGQPGLELVDSWTMTPTVSVNPDGSFAASPMDQDLTSFVTEDISVTGNIDPVISVSFDVVNNAPVTQDFVFTFTLPILPVTPGTITGGSTGVTITDNNGDGATLGSSTLPGSLPFYTATIDGVAYQTLALTPVVEPNTFETETASTLFGSPIPSQVGPAALSTIGLEYRFTLTPGDRAAVTGNFVVETIPEPASIALLAAGLGVVGLRRRWA